MPDDVVRNVIRWIQCNYFNLENTSKVVYALSWLQGNLNLNQKLDNNISSFIIRNCLFLGVMEYNLVNMDILDIYYEFFFYLLNFDKFVSKFLLLKMYI